MDIPVDLIIAVAANIVAVAAIVAHDRWNRSSQRDRDRREVNDQRDKDRLEHDRQIAEIHQRIDSIVREYARKEDLTPHLNRIERWLEETNKRLDSLGGDVLKALAAIRHSDRS